MGPGGREAHSPAQARLRVDLPLRLREAHHGGGVLADPAYGEEGTVLAGLGGVRQRARSRRGQTHRAGRGPGRVAHLRRGRASRRYTPGVAALGLSGAYARGEAVALEQRSHSQPALRRDLRGGRSASRALRTTARSGRDHQEPDQLPLVASDGMTTKELFTRIPYQMARRGVAASDKALQLATLVLAQAHGVLFLFLGIKTPPRVRLRSSGRPSGGTHDTREGILL